MAGDGRNRGRTGSAGRLKQRTRARRRCNHAKPTAADAGGNRASHSDEHASGGSATSSDNASDARGFEELYERWWPAVVAHARKYVASDDDAADAAQMVFTRLWENGGWRDICFPSTYLRQAARNAARRLCDRYDREVPVGDADLERLLPPTPSPYVLWMRELRWKLLLTLLRDFPTKTRAVMVHTYVTGLSGREVAERMGVTLKAVEKRLARGREIARDRLDTRLGRSWVSTFEDGGG